MLTLDQLVRLERSLRDRRVLSIYIEGSPTDPASPRSWRVRLNQQLNDLSDWLVGSAHEEREELAAAIRQLEATLPVDRTKGFRGWAAFVTADAVHEVGPLPVPVSTLAVWSTGMCVAPYMRVLKEARPVVVAVVDATKADIYRYRLGALETLETVHAHHVVMEPSHMGSNPARGFHTGTRGVTGRDAAQRSLHQGTERMLHRSAELLARVAGDDGWIVVGGIPRESAALVHLVSRVAPDRVWHARRMDVHASESRIMKHARLAASSLRAAADARRIGEIADEDVANGLGALGPTASRAALEQQRVRELYLTHSYLQNYAAEAEESARAALDQGALVEEVSGVAAAMLDARGGVAARLRYRLHNGRETR